MSCASRCNYHPRISASSKVALLFHELILPLVLNTRPRVRGHPEASSGLLVRGRSARSDTVSATRHRRTTLCSRTNYLSTEVPMGLNSRLVRRKDVRPSDHPCRLRTGSGRSVEQSLFRSYPFLRRSIGDDPDVSSRFIRKRPAPCKPIPDTLGTSIICRGCQPKISELVPKLTKPSCRF